MGKRCASSNDHLAHSAATILCNLHLEVDLR
jgi:hypothetical protein